MQQAISAAILSGGLAKRFGGVSKSNIIVGGRPVISWMIDALSGLFSEIIMITNNPSENNLSGLKTIPDIFPGIGPLGGIHAALNASSTNAVFIVAGDMPLINREIIALQIGLYEQNHPDALIPRIGDYIEPLHSVCSKNILPSLEKYILEKNSRAVWEFFRTVKTEYFKPSTGAEADGCFLNLNTPEDAARIEKILANRI